MGHNHSKRKDSLVSSSIDKLEIVKEEKPEGKRRKTRRGSSKVEIIENKAPEKEVEKKQEDIPVVVENNENEDKQNENNDKQQEPEVDIRKVQIIEVEEERKVGYILDTSETERQWREKEEQEKLKKEQQEKDKVKDNNINEDEEKEKETEKEKEKQLCPLCEKEVPSEEIHSLQTCGHSICFHCIYEFLKTILDEGEKPACPVENCDTPVHISDLKAALEVFGAIEKEGESKLELPEEKKVEEEFQYPSLRESVGVLPVSLTQSLEMYIASNEFVIRCPNPNCGNIFERLPPTKTNEVVKDDKGQPLSKEALNHYFENRFRCRLCTTIFCAQCNANPYHLGKTCRQNLEALQAKSCRYCGEPVSESALPYVKSGVARESWVSRLRKKIEYKKANDIDFKGLTQDKINQLVAERDARMEASGEFFVCSEDECQEKAKMSCPIVTKCKHLCGGVKGEKKCLRCLKPDCCEDGSTTNEDYCNICWVEDIASAPSVELTCGHVFHFNCIKQRVDEGWSTSYISFTFANCPLCSTPIDHPLLELQDLRNLEAQVKELAVQRLGLEGMKDDAEILEGGPYFGREADYGILKLAFYQCARCKKPYFGGRKQCDPGAGQENEGGRKFNKDDLVCGTCAGVNSTCPVHGQETVEFKCRFCCSLATFFCAGLTHFCTPCHDIAGQMVDFADWSTKWESVKPCSGIETCPLGVPHPRNGEEYSLGCGLCRIQRLAERESEKKKE